MLVLSRKKFESIVIGDGITVTVIEIRGDKVRLGITAPSHVPVHRQEVYDAIMESFTALPPLALEPVGSAEPDDLLPDLIVECRLTEGQHGRAGFTSEGGFFFRGRPEVG